MSSTGATRSGSPSRAPHRGPFSLTPPPAPPRTDHLLSRHKVFQSTGGTADGQRPRTENEQLRAENEQLRAELAAVKVEGWRLLRMHHMINSASFPALSALSSSLSPNGGRKEEATQLTARGRGGSGDDAHGTAPAGKAGGNERSGLSGTAVSSLPSSSSAPSATRASTGVMTTAAMQREASCSSQLFDLSGSDSSAHRFVGSIPSLHDSTIRSNSSDFLISPTTGSTVDITSLASDTFTPMFGASISSSSTTPSVSSVSSASSGYSLSQQITSNTSHIPMGAAAFKPYLFSPASSPYFNAAQSISSSATGAGTATVPIPVASSTPSLRKPFAVPSANLQTYYLLQLQRQQVEREQRYMTLPSLPPPLLPPTLPVLTSTSVFSSSSCPSSTSSSVLLSATDDLKAIKASGASYDDYVRHAQQYASSAAWRRNAIILKTHRKRNRGLQSDQAVYDDYMKTKRPRRQRSDAGQLRNAKRQAPSSPSASDVASSSHPYADSDSDSDSDSHRT